MFFSSEEKKLHNIHVLLYHPVKRWFIIVDHKWRKRHDYYCVIKIQNMPKRWINLSKKFPHITCVSWQCVLLCHPVKRWSITVDNITENKWRRRLDYYCVIQIQNMPKHWINLSKKFTQITLVFHDSSSLFWNELYEFGILFYSKSVE